jgi:hypothetical protein
LATSQPQKRKNKPHNRNPRRYAGEIKQYKIRRSDEGAANIIIFTFPDNGMRLIHAVIFFKEHPTVESRHYC